MTGGTTSDSENVIISSFLNLFWIGGDLSYFYIKGGFGDLQRYPSENGINSPFFVLLVILLNNSLSQVITDLRAPLGIFPILLMTIVSKLPSPILVFLTSFPLLVAVELLGSVFSPALFIGPMS